MDNSLIDRLEVSLLAADKHGMCFIHVGELKEAIEALKPKYECKHSVPLDWACNACSDSGNDPRLAHD